VLFWQENHKPLFGSGLSRLGKGDKWRSIGLGLAVVNGIVKKHNGFIKFFYRTWRWYNISNIFTRYHQDQETFNRIGKGRKRSITFIRADNAG